MKHFLLQNRFSRHAYPLAALAVLLAAGAAQGQTPASFAAASNYSASTYSAGAGSFPRSLAVADVNGDGRPDLVTANYGNSTAGVLLGQAGGGFAPVSAYPIGANSYPQGIAVADVNGDGRPDLVTANNNNSGTVGVLLGLAGGGFSPVSNYPTGGVYAISVAVADVNGDGRSDLVTANNGDNTVGVLLGQAGGGFSPGITYPTAAVHFPQGIAVRDVNGDGRPDLVTANFASSAGVLLQQAGGGFAAISAYSTGVNSTPVGSNSGPGSVTVADVNGDGLPDLVTANYYSSAAGVLLGQAGGGFAATSTYATGAYSSPLGIAVGDVNGDGRPDLVTANDGNGTAGVLLGQAGGGFGAANAYSTGASRGPEDVAVADVNGDGRLDLVTANAGSNTVSVLLNTGTFTPLATTPAASVAEAVVFPNPAHTGFAVQLPAAWGAAPVRAELRNALGQVVATRTATLSGGDLLAFATDALAPGVYVLHVQAGTCTLNKRVLLD